MDGGEHEVEESSSKRRERLLALRSAATASAAEAPPAAPAASLLPDPDLSGDQAPFPGPRPPQRFDYYTNPAAAFSSHSGGATDPSHKRKSPPAYYDPPPPAGNYGSNYGPPRQQYMAPSPVHSPSPMPRDASGNTSWQSPMQFQDPMSGYQGAPPGARPPWGPHNGPRGRGFYSDSPNFGFRHPNPGRGGSPMNYGPRGSPHSSYGRGRGANYCGNPGSGSRGRGGMGGIGFRNHPGWQNRSYFNKLMVDDPWLDLQPIVGNILIPRGDSRSWLPESLREKKETPVQGQIKSNLGLSLSEYLDLSFNEVSNKEA